MYELLIFMEIFYKSGYILMSANTSIITFRIPVSRCVTLGKHLVSHNIIFLNSN